MNSQPASALPAAPTSPASPTPDHPAPLPGQPLLAVGQTDAPNGAPIPPASRSAKGRARGKRSTLLLYVAAAVLLVAGTATAYVLIEKPFNKPRTDLVSHTVQYGRLELKIVERGTLESANNSDITCGVKAKAQGSTFATTIRNLVDDGTFVQYDRPKEQVKTAFVWDEKQGRYTIESISESGRVRCVKVKDEKTGRWIYADLLMELDDSSLQDQLSTQSITLDGARDDELQAEKALAITLAQAAADIQAAGVDVEVAEINLKKYQEGDYIKTLKDYEGQIKDAQSKVEQQRDRVAWAYRMLKKNFYTASQAQSEQLSLESLELTLGKAEEQMRVLRKYEKDAQEIDLKGKVATKKATLANVRSKAQEQAAKDRSALNAKKSVHAQQESRYKDLVDQIQKCKVWAPRSGIVVYYIPEQARWGVGSRQSIVAQGEQVGEGQKMMQIPDLDHMVVITKVHEALASRVHKGQRSQVKVESFPDQALRAHVESVSTVAAAADFLSADVKVYTTKIAIDKALEGLKPGMSAEVTITIGDALEHVLKVPIEAVIGSAEMGKSRKVFVLTPEGPQEREVLVGGSNDQEVEIREGLKEGEKVVLNPKILVGDSVKTRKRGEYQDEETPGKPVGPSVPSGPGTKPGQGGPAAGAPGAGAGVPPTGAGSPAGQPRPGLGGPGGPPRTGPPAGGPGRPEAGGPGSGQGGPGGQPRPGQ